ncbi:patatin-like protein [Streptomyces sp. RGM 3693]|uniref:patatin-like protein n=1 Tax=Streptomyces sp. RGM 3693 TaxID=3413284 RepID=UPI003D26EF0B
MEPTAPARKHRSEARGTASSDPQVGGFPGRTSAGVGMTTENSVARHETRLALVLNGGVSLAVWMGGVTHEMDLLRRASDLGSEEPEDARDREVFAIWRRLAQKARTKVVIDIVSGTSAGGINGLILATAIARGAQLPPLKDLWTHSASLENLLTPPPRMSVLNGDTFASEVHNALQHIKGSPEGSTHPVTLFVTATALDGRDQSYRDGFGTEFQVRDHRRLYRFQQEKKSEHLSYELDDQQEWNFTKRAVSHFTGESLPELVQAARATAGFPVAFRPVSEFPMVDRRVLPNPELDFPASCVIDGGVLNNAPFGPVLQEITRRKLDVPMKRVVVYVVPSVGRLAQESTKKSLCSEITWNTAALNAIRYPQEVNLRSGMEDLAALLSTSIRDQQADLFQRLSAPESQGEGKLYEHVRGVAKKLNNEYRRNRAIALLYNLRKQISQSSDISTLIVTPELDSERVDGILGAHRCDNGTWKNPSWLPRWDQDLDFDPAQPWNWGIIAAERVIQCLIGRLLELLEEEKREHAQECLGVGGRKVSRCLREVLALADALDAELRRTADPNDLAEEGAARLYDEVFVRLGIPDRLREIVRTASESYVQAMAEAELHNGWSAQEVVNACLTVEVLTRVYAPPSQLVEPLAPKFAFLRLGPDTMSPLFHVDHFDDFGERKLYGTRLAHFGAFANPAWRQSDFAWGRLDAAHHLLRLLGGMGEQERRREEKLLHQAILTAEARRTERPAGLGRRRVPGSGWRAISWNSGKPTRRCCSGTSRPTKGRRTSSRSATPYCGCSTTPAARILRELMDGTRCGGPPWNTAGPPSPTAGTWSATTPSSPSASGARRVVSRRRTCGTAPGRPTNAPRLTCPRP